MPTPLPSGTISLADVDVYLGAPATQLISLNDTPVRAIAGIPTGTIAMSNLQGKPGNPFIISISTDQANYDVRAKALAAGWNGTDAVTVNIANGVVIYSSSTGSYAMTVNGAFPGGLTINNNGGYIVGMGGAGGGAGTSAGSPGSSGGPALFVGSVFTLNNQGTIASGGGGGGGGGGETAFWPPKLGGTIPYPGGGGGGGRTGRTNSAGGSPGGTAGTFTTFGSGGAGSNDGTYGGFPGGSGGAWGSTGGSGSPGAAFNNNWLPKPEQGSPGGAGGIAGTAVVGNGLVNYTNTGTIIGPVTNGDETVLTISTPQTSTYNINTQATAAGWNGTRRLRVVINPGVSVVSASTGTAAMVATGAFPNALIITNNGYIVGKGGDGGSGGSGNNSLNMTAGSAGGIALSITGTTSAVYMVNNGTIAGGGGGGGGGRGFFSPSGTYYGGGGGGGTGLGGGGPSGGGSAAAGSSGTTIAGGAGGAPSNSVAGAGGSGGPLGTAGSSGGSSFSGNPGAAGGSAGWAVYGDNLITYVTTGSIIGARQSTVANIPITSPQINLDALTLANASGWNGVAQVNLIISPGVTISSASVGTPSLTISGTFPNGITLTNNGTISGAGGNGGDGAYWYLQKGYGTVPGAPGISAGTALYVTTSGVPVTNNGTIAGGGGGGGGGSVWTSPRFPAGSYFWGGNGGGGGAGNISGVGGAGGAGGPALIEFGNPGANGNPGGSTTGGSGNGGGATGGPGGNSVSGAGGNLGSGGGTGVSGPNGSGGPGGAAGSAVVGTANITWLATGTRIGPIS